MCILCKIAFRILLTLQYYYVLRCCVSHVMYRIEPLYICRVKLFFSYQTPCYYHVLYLIVQSLLVSCIYICCARLLLTFLTP